jgi:hypothetical protein
MVHVELVEPIGCPASIMLYQPHEHAFATDPSFPYPLRRLNGDGSLKEGLVGQFCGILAKG